MKKKNLKTLSKGIACVIALSSVMFNTKTVNAVVYPESLYEAENAVKSGVNVNTNHDGYTGNGFIDSFGEKGDYVEFTVNIPSNGDYTLRFKYANNTGNTVVRGVYVDGNFISKGYFKNLANWDTWGISDVGTNLSAGRHTIKLAVDNVNDGYINLDNMIVTTKSVSVTSLYTSNWSNMMAIWKNSKLSVNDNNISKGPRLDELRYSGNWNVNQIQDYSSFFRDETNNKKYNQSLKFDSEGYFDENGVLHNNFLKYDNEYINNIEISKDYVTVPNENFIVARYTLKNRTSSPITYSVLDMLHPNNTSNNDIKANYDSSKKAIIVNMSSANQPCLALGAFDTPTYYQCANDSDFNTSSNTVSPWISFDNNGTLKNNGNVSAKNVSVAYGQKVNIPANSSVNVYFYLALGNNLNDINSICDRAKSKGGEAWFNTTASAYNNWFAGKNIPNLSDNELTSVYKRNLVMIKNCTRPGYTSNDGAMPATTNPMAYSYKIWARDSAVTAMSLDAAGFTSEGDRYWRWLAARQSQDGTFHTCFSLWDNTNANFVEPEYDSMGIFLMGAYRHYELTKDKAFLDAVYPAIKKTSNFIMNNIDQFSGFGPADKSIWEEGDYPEYYTYTQASYAMGLKSAAQIAEIEGEPNVADSFNGAGSTILTAINRDDTDTKKGLWNVTNGYYNRCINTNNTVNALEDTSTNVLFAFGAIDVSSGRAASHINKMERDLAADKYGLPRYANDTFYYTSPWSPSGNEALEASPSWPQMTMWDSVYQSYIGNKAKAYDMLQWFKHRTGTGFMVTGEAASNITEAPLVSTASEPVTAAAYILACLAYNGYDMRTYASENNAGAFKAINVTAGAKNDWEQYKYVPYYTDKMGDNFANDGRTDIKKVYISNDANNIYLRIDNTAGNLNGFDSNNKFEMTVYAEDFNKKAATTTNSQYGTALNRNMAYMFTRKSTEDNFNKCTVSNGKWTFNKNVTGVIAPQWDPSTGRIEIVIPRSEVGATQNGAWGHITVALSGTTSGNFKDSDILQLNYRLTDSNESWLYGNFE